MSLTGQVALIPGGVKNLGAQIARELAAQGANLALHYHSAGSQSDASSLSAELKQKYPSLKIATFQGDLTRAAAVTKLFQDTQKEFGKIDIVVNTVGKVLKKPITEISEEEYDEMFAYAVPFPFLLSRHSYIFPRNFTPRQSTPCGMVLNEVSPASTPKPPSSFSKKLPRMSPMGAR